MNKIIISLVIASIILTSCGGVTPVPTVTPTFAPTLTATITPRPVSISTPEAIAEEQQSLPSVQLWKHLPPDQFVDHYELREWSPEFYKTMTDLLDNVNAEYYEYLRQRSDNFHASFASEAWLRTDSKMDNNPWLCDVTYYRPSAKQFPETRPGQDLFSFFVEDLINNRGVAEIDLSDTFSNLAGTSDCLGGFSLFTTGNIYFEPNVVQNIFGDGQPSYVFVVGSLFWSDSRIAVYATHVVDGFVQVELVRNWEKYFPIASTYDFHIVDIGDLNKNGRNEFVIQVDFRSSGYPGGGAEWIYLNEWNEKTSSFSESDRIIIFSLGSLFFQGCWHNACLGDWKFASGNNSGMLKLTTREYINTDLDACQLIAREKEYSVSFEKITLLSDGYVPPNESLPACQISWAYEVLTQAEGWKNDKAIQIVEDALVDWPKEMNKVWGRESESYFQLMLGVWKDFRGENEQSNDLLSPLVTQKRGSDFTFIAQLAQRYLSTRQTKGMINACSAMNGLQDELLFEKYGQKATQYMGFGGNIWPTFVDDFCDQQASVSATFSRADFSNFDENSLREWLTNQGKDEIYIQKVAIANQEIFLATFLSGIHQKYDFNYYQLWSFSNIAGQQKALYLNGMSLDVNRVNVSDRYTEDSVIVDVFESKQVYTIVLTEFDNCLTFLGINSDDVEVLQNKCDIRLVFSQDNGMINVMLNDWSPRTWRFVSYVWDDSTQSLIEIPSQDYDFETVQNKAESLVFREKNYAGAIVYISNSLASSPPDQVFWPDCYDYVALRKDDIEEHPSITLCDQPMEWHRPHLLYLLAMSYEMSGQSDNAKATYYLLWHDYPDNVFGVAASLRLEPISP